MRQDARAQQRRRRRGIAPAVLTAVTAIVYSCSDCPPQPEPPRLLSGYALTGIVSATEFMSLPALYRTEPDGRRLRIFADTLRFQTQDDSYTESGLMGAQSLGQAEVMSRVATPTPAPHFEVIAERSPFSIRLPQFVAGAATATLEFGALIVTTADGLRWQYTALPDAR